MLIYLSLKPKIELLLAKKITVLIKYLNYTKVFFKKIQL